MTGSGMRSPEMRKKRRLRSVCAPHSRSAGTSIGPKLSFSVRLPLIAALCYFFSGLRRIRREGAASGEIEQQDFGAFALFKNEARHVRLERVAGLQRGAVDHDLAA